MKAKARDQIFARSNGLCIYCGGAQVATTIDHMPPIIMFRDKDRPKGYEFSSCEQCNNGAGHSDLVAAMIARTFPAIEQSEEMELAGIFRAIGNNIPAVLSEMFVDRSAQAQTAARIGVSLSDYKFIRIDGPLCMAYLSGFGARLGFAMHFHQTGRIVPKAGGASVRLYSNLDLIEGRVPDELIQVLPSPSTLTAGKKHVGSQFKISTRVAEGDGMTITFASFRMSFAVMVATADDAGKLRDPDFPPQAEPIKPGYLLNI